MAINVRILKLINGDELIAEVVNDTASEITIKNAVRIVVMPSKNDPRTPQIGLAPWAEFSEEKSFTIHKAHVITTMKPVQEFVNQYNGMFSGILLPEKTIII